MRKTTVDKVNDWIKWWNWHRTTMDNASLENKVAFLAKAVQGSLDCIVTLTEEMREVEYGRATEKRIILPIGVKFSEPIRQKDAA